MKIRLVYLLGLTLAASGLTGSAQVVFSDNFDLATPLNNAAPGYTVNMSSADNRVIFGYDYSSANLGIPSAPHSVGGTQLGVRFDANLSAAAVGSVVISPNATFAGDYTVHFDLWMNSAGTFPGGGTGSSENLTTGFGYNKTSFQNASSASGVWFSVTGDGGFSGTSGTPDYEARVGTTLQAPGSGVYAAGTATGPSGASVDNANPFYTALFPGQSPPAGQVNLNANQTGTAANGSMLFKWHNVGITRSGTVSTWSIDGNLIASVTNSAATATDSFEVGYWDPASSVDNGLVFAVIDNLEVTSIPEPSVLALGLIAAGTTATYFVRRRKARA